MDVTEVIVETYQQALCKADVLGRNNDTQSECTQHEDKYRNQCADKHSLRIVFGRIVYILHVDTAHLHTCIKEEDTCGKHHIVKVRQVGEKAAVEVHIGMSACGEVDNAEDNQ